MSWPLATVTLGAFGFVGVLVWLVLPYLRPRSELTARVEALEEATAAIQQTQARMLGGVPLPRNMPRVG